MATCSFSSGFDAGFETVCAPVVTPSPDGGGWDTRLLVAPRPVRLIELAGELRILVVGRGTLTVTLDEDLAAALGNAGVWMMLNEEMLALAAVAGLRGPRAARVRDSLIIGDPAIAAATIEEALTWRP